MNSDQQLTRELCIRSIQSFLPWFTPEDEMTDEALVEIKSVLVTRTTEIAEAQNISFDEAAKLTVEEFDRAKESKPGCSTFSMDGDRTQYLSDVQELRQQGKEARFLVYHSICQGLLSERVLNEDFFDNPIVIRFPIECPRCKTVVEDSDVMTTDVIYRELEQEGDR